MTSQHAGIQNGSFSGTASKSVLNIGSVRLSDNRQCRHLEGKYIAPRPSL